MQKIILTFTKFIFLTQVIWLAKWDIYHKRKKPRDTTAILTSCNCSWTSKRRYPEEAFIKQSLSTLDQNIILAMEDGIIYPKNSSVTVNYELANKHTSSATFESARYSPIHTGIVASVGRHPGKKWRQVKKHRFILFTGFSVPPSTYLSHKKPFAYQR